MLHVKNTVFYRHVTISTILVDAEKKAGFIRNKEPIVSSLLQWRIPGNALSQGPQHLLASVSNSRVKWGVKHVAFDQTSKMADTIGLDYVLYS